MFAEVVRGAYGKAWRAMTRLKVSIKLVCFGSRLRSRILLDELPEPFEVRTFCFRIHCSNRKRSPPQASNDQTSK
jgi:hypothetical protein